MISNKSNIIVYYYKKSNTRELITQQTKNIREIANQKIRQLGDKYFKIKSLFDQLSLKRDDLFLYAKKLEEDYQNIKHGIKIRNQMKRAKDWLYCWYAEFFFDELINPDSVILKGLIENCYKPKKELNSLVIKKTETLQKSSKQENENIHAINTNIFRNNMFFQPIAINQEIDTIKFSNIELYSANEMKNNSQSDNLSYDFDKLFKF